MDRFSQVCEDFGLTISPKKTDVLGQNVDTPPVITIDSYELDVVHQFTYLGSTISDNLSLDVEINQRIGKAATQYAPVRQRDLDNIRQTRAKAEQLPLALLSSHAQVLARYAFEPFTRRSDNAGWAGSAMCAGWKQPHTEGHPLRRTSLWQEMRWPPPATLQRCLQARHESSHHQH